MVAFTPFRALRPGPADVAQLAAPPYDVLDEAEAAALATGRPHSFLHVTRPEIDLPPGPDGAAPDPHSDAAYAASRTALDRLVADGVLVADARPAYTVYAAPAADGSGATQVGVVGLVGAAEYRAGVIRTHEHTRPDKLADRTRHIEAVCGHDEPVLLLAPPDGDVDRVLAEVTATAPALAVDDGEPGGTRTADGGTFRLWVVDDPDHVKTLETAFAAMPDLYVADGHHRSEAAALVWEAHGRPAGDELADPVGWFPALVIPADRACVLPYDRVVADLGGHDRACLLEALTTAFEVTPSDRPVRPDRRGRIGMYLRAGGPDSPDGTHLTNGTTADADGGWYVLDVRHDLLPADADPVARLDVSTLQNLVLDPLLGITEPRTDPRIGFLGGRTPQALAGYVDAGRAAVAFTLHPTSPDDVMAVARTGAVMPPKSTWFAPKPYSGLFVHRFV